MEDKVLTVGESVRLEKDDSSNSKDIGNSKQEDRYEHHWL